MDCPPGNEDRHQISKFSRKNSFVGHSHPSVPPLAALGESGKFSWLFVKKKKKKCYSSILPTQGSYDIIKFQKSGTD